MTTTYVFDNSALAETSCRFANLERLFDERTQRLLASTGVGSGWRCLEIGAGSGSIAAWLSGKAGAQGHVLVTDIDPRFLSGLAALKLANTDIRVHDIVRDPLQESAFDLIHARLVLIHLAQRDEVLQRLVRSLKPGGWLVIEDFDRIFDGGAIASDACRLARHACKALA